MAGIFEIGDIKAERGSLIKGELVLCRLNDGSAVGSPLLVANGAQDGPAVWLGSAVHGIELGGSEVIRRLLREEIDPKRLRGTVIGAPIMNPLAFRASDRLTNYDRNDMNRMFGEGEPSISRTMAHNLYKLGISKADYVVDYHSCNPPSIDFTILKHGEDEATSKSLELAKAYGVTITSPRSDSAGTLTGRAVADGKPAVCVELVFSRRLDAPSIRSGVLGTKNILVKLGMIEGEVVPQKDTTVIPGEHWYQAVYCSTGGIVTLLKGVGEKVAQGETFAIVRDAYGQTLEEICSPVDGYVIAYPMQGNQALASGDKLAYIAWPK